MTSCTPGVHLLRPRKEGMAGSPFLAPRLRGLPPALWVPRPGEWGCSSGGLQGPVGDMGAGPGDLVQSAVLPLWLPGTLREPGSTAGLLGG